MEFDAATVRNANMALALLVDMMDNDYEKVMRAELSDSEYKHNTKTLANILAATGINEPAGAVATGTGIIKEKVPNLSGEDAQKAIQALKQSNQIQQCGRGRGKCLVILGIKPLPGEQEAEPTDAKEVPEDEDNLIDASNVPALLRCVRDNFRELERQLHESRRNERNMTKLISDLQAQVKDRDQKIDELENTAQLKAVATWQ